MCRSVCNKAPMVSCGQAILLAVFSFRMLWNVLNVASKYVETAIGCLQDVTPWPLFKYGEDGED